MLYENEIFDRMKGCLKAAINDCDHIASEPKSGPRFISLRANLKLVEGCCRQAGHWREDSRWFPMGVMIEEAHQRARTWLHRPSVQSKKLFTMLAANLKQMFKALEVLQTAKTGRTGRILPVVKPTIRTRSSIHISGYRTTRAGIILPA